jgi:hypothetical protein
VQQQHQQSQYDVAIAEEIAIAEYGTKEESRQKKEEGDKEKTTSQPQPTVIANKNSET